MSVRERAGVQALFLLASEARGTEHWMPNWSFEPDSNSGALLGVLKLRHSLQRLPSSTGKNYLVIDRLELRNRDGDIVLRQAEKAASIDDGI